MIPKEWVLDRVEQSFELLFKSRQNYLNLFLPYFAYKFIFVIIIWNIFYYWLMNFFDFSSLSNSSNFSWIISDLFWNTEFIIAVNVFLIFLLLNLILIIPFILTTYKTIGQIIQKKEEINYIDNITYWFKNLSNSFKTYWYMFVYVALIPSLIIIVWGLFLLFWLIQNLDIILQVWMFIWGWGIILLIIFAIYRWYKTLFSIISAVDHDKYSQGNFNNSVLITKNNWWRIVWNFILIWLIISLVGWIINSVIWIFKFSVSDFDYMWLISTLNWNLDQEKISSIVWSLTNWIWVFSIKDLLFDVLDLILEVIKIVFMFIFTYLFYKRLELELKNKNIDPNSYDEINNNITNNNNIKIRETNSIEL